MDNSRAAAAPPSGPRRQDGDRLPSWKQNDDRRDRQRSRSPRNDRYDDRKRDRSIEREGPRNRERQREPPRGPRAGNNGRGSTRGRRGSASSANSDTSPHRYQRGQGQMKRPSDDKKEVLVEDHTPLKDIDNWVVEPAELKRILGIANFDSTKETKVPGNDQLYGVSKTKKSEYRQYMNRVGGFNRPLSPTRGNQFAKVADTKGIED